LPVGATIASAPSVPDTTSWGHPALLVVIAADTAHTPVASSPSFRSCVLSDPLQTAYVQDASDNDPAP